jgi:simple sugar transport system permease protein
MNSVLDIIFTTNFLLTTIRVMTPVLFAALACMVYGKAGIDAIATEGIMLMAALAGVVGSAIFGSAFAGVLAAILTGILASFVFGYVTINMGSVPILAGIAVNTFAGGATIFVVYLITGNKGSTQSLASKVVPNVELGIIKNIPIVGEVLSGHNLLTYLALALVLVLYLVLYKTPLGLRIRSVGENEHAAQSVGISVIKYKYYALAIAGTMVGLGGAFMTMGYVSFFSKGMTAGRGFIGMAAESMGRGTPIGVLLSSMLFGAADSLAVRLQMMDFPPQLIQMIPYLITIIAIAIYSYLNHKKKEKA